MVQRPINAIHALKAVFCLTENAWLATPVASHALDPAHLNAFHVSLLFNYSKVPAFNVMPPAILALGPQLMTVSPAEPLKFSTAMEPVWIATGVAQLVPEVTIPNAWAAKNLDFYTTDNVWFVTRAARLATDQSRTSVPVAMVLLFSMRKPTPALNVIAPVRLATARDQINVWHVQRDLN